MNPTASAPRLSRRHFLHTSGLAAAALAAHASAPALRAAAAPTAKKRPAIGIELYAVRGEMAKDLPGTLKAVAKMGYECVEFYSAYFA
ncbi:MAG: sugar phosphate isomerase/epimerase, partial [Opitutaceae bacterium]|nr:sugar phosphate isomerase/epimerase [Opitutaceae bacterium]